MEDIFKRLEVILRRSNLRSEIKIEGGDGNNDEAAPAVADAASAEVRGGGGGGER
jgi:hypothetical protein